METVRAQSIIDLSVERYGNADAIGELLLLNDFSGKMDNPAYVGAMEVDLAFSVVAGTDVVNDTASPFYDKRAMQALAGRRIATGIKSNYHIFNKIFSKAFH